MYAVAPTRNTQWPQFVSVFSLQATYCSVVLDGAAEEAGLMVGDLVLTVNGTDVTSNSHSEATDLARQGMLLPGLIMGCKKILDQRNKF